MNDDVIFVFGFCPAGSIECLNKNFRKLFCVLSFCNFHFYIEMGFSHPFQCHFLVYVASNLITSSGTSTVQRVLVQSQRELGRSRCVLKFKAGVIKIFF